MTFELLELLKIDLRQIFWAINNETCSWGRGREKHNFQVWFQFSLDTFEHFRGLSYLKATLHWLRSKMCALAHFLEEFPSGLVGWDNAEKNFAAKFFFDIPSPLPLIKAMATRLLFLFHLIMSTLKKLFPFYNYFLYRDVKNVCIHAVLTHELILQELCKKVGFNSKTMQFRMVRSCIINIFHAVTFGHQGLNCSLNLLN